MKVPLITVIMSVYNGQRYIHDAIDSILKQTFTDFEFIITNDGSTDGSDSVIDKFAARDDRIRVFHQANAGLTVALNRMIAESRGVYIARMDADDLSHPLRFEKQWKYLVENPSCGIVGTGWLDIDDEGRAIAGYVLPDAHDFLVSRLERGLHVYRHGSIMVKKNVLMAQEGPYRFRYGQDFDLFLRLSQNTKMGMIQEVLFLYRTHGGAIQGAVGPFRQKQMALMLELHRARQQELREPLWRDREEFIFPTHLDLSEGNLTSCLYIRGVMAFQRGSMTEARKCFRNTCRCNGNRARSTVYLILALLPLRLGRRFINMLHYFRDELRDYRVPPENWADILKACGQGE